MSSSELFGATDAFSWPGILVNPIAWLAVYFLVAWAWHRWRRIAR